MKQIRLVKVGSSDTGTISNLSSTLNSLQNEFFFSFDSTDVIPISGTSTLSNQVSSDKVEALIHRYAEKNSIRDYVIGICDVPLKDKIVTSSDQKKAVISTKGWEISFSKHSISTVITYGMIDIIFESLGISTPTHDQFMACPMDCCLGEKEPLLAGLKKADFCPDCRSLIYGCVTDGRLKLQQLVSIYKLLDFIAERKTCFVLMPFCNSFDDIYKKCIQATMDSLSWNCTRADEIHQPHEIIDQIWERILRADLIIADLTGRNPNVFYELGYAHALNKSTILLTQNINDVPFDLRHRRLVSYSASKKDQQKLKNELRKYVL